MSVIDDIAEMNSLDVLDILDDIATEATAKADGQTWALKLAKLLAAASDRLRETIPNPIPHDEPKQSETAKTEDNWQETPEEEPQIAPESTISSEVDSGHPGFNRTVTRRQEDQDDPETLVTQASMAVARLATGGHAALLQRLHSQVTIEARGIEADTVTKLELAKSLVGQLWDAGATPELESLLEAVMQATDNPKPALDEPPEIKRVG